MEGQRVAVGLDLGLRRHVVWRAQDVQIRMLGHVQRVRIEEALQRHNGKIRRQKIHKRSVVGPNSQRR